MNRDKDIADEMEMLLLFFIYGTLIFGGLYILYLMICDTFTYMK